MAKEAVMWMVFLFEAITVGQYMNRVFPSKREKKFLWLSFSAAYLILFFVYWLDMVALNLLAFTLFNFLIALYNYDVGVKAAFFHSVMITAFMNLGEVFVILIMWTLFGENVARTERLDLFIVTTVLCKLMFFVVCKLAGKVAARENNHEHVVSRGYYLLAALPLATFILLSNMYLMIAHSPVEVQNNLVLTFGTLLLLFANVIVFGVYESVIQASRKIAALELAQSQQSRDHRFYELLRKQYQEIRMLSHDIRNHLQTMEILLEQGEVEKARSYLSDISESYNLYNGVTVSGNKMLDVICSRYVEECAAKDIKFTIENEGITLDFLNDVDLCAIMTNILDNAVEACSKMKKGSGEVHLSIYIQNDALTVINLVNSCGEPPIEQNHEFVSTKEDAVGHGIGLPSVKRSVEKYGGLCDFYFDGADGTFHTNLAFDRIDKSKRTALK